MTNKPLIKYPGPLSGAEDRTGNLGYAPDQPGIENSRTVGVRHRQHAPFARACNGWHAAQRDASEWRCAKGCQRVAILTEPVFCRSSIEPQPPTLRETSFCRGREKEEALSCNLFFTQNNDNKFFYFSTKNFLRTLPTREAAARQKIKLFHTRAVFVSSQEENLYPK